MKLVLTSKSKSLEPFSTELPDFVVLTGLNGAGKTQILKAIHSNAIIVTDDSGAQIHSSRYVASADLAPNNSEIATREQSNGEIKNFWQAYLNLKEAHKYQSGVHSMSPDGFIEFARHYKEGGHQVNVSAIEAVLTKSNKSYEQVTQNDFREFYPIKYFFTNTDVFNQNLSMIFKRYYDRLEENIYRRFKKEQKGDNSVYVLSDEEFITDFGNAPWDFLNDIIAEAKLDYYVNSPLGLDRDSPFDLKLINKLSNTAIDFSDLSSGEKVIMSLALAMYNSENNKKFPGILLMDEPDASLHPSMIKQFLDVIENIFVKQKGVKVIMTTHSPSTVALCPESALFVVNKGGGKIEKVSKDKGLKILTSGVPSFSVLYENRRQVFVESPNDVLFYENIYQRLAVYLNPEISLTFISSGESRTDKNGTKISNCGQVKNIVNILRADRNQFIWGIIDWDIANTSDEFVKVIGGGKRYSIESYLLDPLLVGAYLLRQKMVLSQEMGLSEGENYATLLKLGMKPMQTISDYIVSKVRDTLIDSRLWKNESMNSELTIVVTAGEVELTIPTWYLLYQGHKLEELIIKTFPKLESVKRGKEEALKLELIKMVVDDYPEIISKDFVDVFKSVQAI